MAHMGAVDSSLVRRLLRVLPSGGKGERCRYVRRLT